MKGIIDIQLYVVHENYLHLGNVFEAFVLEKDKNAGNALYSSSLAGACSTSIEVAKKKTLSEAIERKAFYENVESGAFGFSENPTTDGMAAHWWGFKARRNAKHEALERWTLHHWWNDLLSFERVHLKHPHRSVLTKRYENYKTTVVLICDYREESGFFYGFAAHQNYEKAYKKALVELDRNHRVLSIYNKKKPELTEFREKRVVYFSTKEGFAEFSKKVRQNEKIKDLAFPEMYLDQEIPGPWQNVRRVWRVLFKQSVPHDYQNLNVFMF